MSAVEQPKKMWGGDIINVPMIIKMNKIEILCATSEACDTDEGLVRYLSETGTFEYLDLELEQRWIADRHSTPSRSKYATSVGCQSHGLLSARLTLDERRRR